MLSGVGRRPNDAESRLGQWRVVRPAELRHAIQRLRLRPVATTRNVLHYQGKTITILFPNAVKNCENCEISVRRSTTAVGDLIKPKDFRSRDPSSNSADADSKLGQVRCLTTIGMLLVYPKRIAVTE